MTTDRCCLPVALLDVLRGGILLHAQDDVERLSGRGEGPLPLLLHSGSLAVSLSRSYLSTCRGRQSGAMIVKGGPVPVFLTIVKFCTIQMVMKHICGRVHVCDTNSAPPASMHLACEATQKSLLELPNRNSTSYVA